MKLQRVTPLHQAKELVTERDLEGTRRTACAGGGEPGEPGEPGPRSSGHNTRPKMNGTQPLGRPEAAGAEDRMEKRNPFLCGVVEGT
ncbi:Hypothetical protein SMAX5B_012907 [Scophthalmus maximus]|uniref:Uncharacterized protein n=1 Tax=Scophthalmus maximus TaxID=52904 RepID=A0A2U9BA94_SCOMX|nr:Hypothetical protein SMAX5B_012907 [Scophthalmus maximus]